MKKKAVAGGEKMCVLLGTGKNKTFALIFMFLVISSLLLVMPVLAGSVPGTIMCWGFNGWGQCPPPAGNNYGAISTKLDYSLALKTDGSIVGWGEDWWSGGKTPPAGNDYQAIAAGTTHSCALKTGGSIVCWGDNNWGEASPPSGNDYAAIATGQSFSLALKTDGSIVGWGRDDSGQATPPAGNNYKAIAAGYNHGLALKTDGSIAGWGVNDDGQATPPAGNNYKALSAGNVHSLALKTDGSIVGWGRNNYGQATPPAGNTYKAIAAGLNYGLALKTDGSIAGWGKNDDGQATPPAGYDYAAIAAGQYHSLAIKATPQSITVISPDGNQTWQPGTAHTITWSQTGLSGTNVRILLMKGYGFNVAETIANPVSATSGSYTWTVPSTIASGTDYWVKIVSLSYPDVQGDMWTGWITIPGTITVTSPNGGESWKAGTPHSVTWSQTGLSGTDVKLELYRDRAFFRSIVSSVAATAGTYTWTIPADIPAGSTYEVWVTSLTNPGVYDYTDGWLTITAAPTIRVITPDGNQTWQPGTAHTITWSQTGLSGTNVRILLMKGYGFNVAETIANPVSATSGSYTWTVPSTIASGTDYWVKIVSLSYPDIQGDMWTGWITIPVTGITVTDPYAGQRILAGEPHWIVWSYEGNPGDTVRIELLKGGVPDTVLTAGTPIGNGGFGDYSWNIPASQAIRDDYSIRISSTLNPAVQDTSDGVFSVVPWTGVKLKAPNGGEYWQQGTTKTISWDYYTIPSANTVWIYLNKGGTRVLKITETAPIGNNHQGSYSWSIPSTLPDGNDYTIQISTIPGGDSDESNASFTISPASLKPLPRNEKLPTDPDGDGIYEDLNGNGRLDFADVVLYFNQMEWIAANEPVSAFDLNRNGRIDFADIVQLFGEI